MAASTNNETEYLAVTWVIQLQELFTQIHTGQHYIRQTDKKKVDYHLTTFITWKWHKYVNFNSSN